MGLIKDRNCIDLTEAEDVKTQKNYIKKIFMTLITMML